MDSAGSPPAREGLSCAALAVIDNAFVDHVRIEMRFDEAEFAALCDALRALAVELRGATDVNRALALVLYAIPQTVRNSAEAVSDAHPIARRLEEAWVDLDALVLDCLADPGAAR